jgi:C4-dicarboxylate transporter DctM subunit
MPIIILGGIYGGIFTPTEAAVFAVVYGIIVGKFVYKELTWKKIIQTYNHTSAFFAGMILIMAPAVVLGPIFSYLQIPEAINGIFLGISQNRYLVLTMIFLLLIPVGMFIGPIEIIIILSPILLGVAEKVGVNPVHFGLIMVLNLCVAFVTPPFAVNLFVASQLSGVSLDRLARVGLPFILAMMIATLIISYFPQISLALLGLLGIQY